MADTPSTPVPAEWAPRRHAAAGACCLHAGHGMFRSLTDRRPESSYICARWLLESILVVGLRLGCAEAVGWLGCGGGQ